MPYLASHDGTRLHYEEAGRGEPIVFVHEFLGGIHGWEPQLRYFSRRYRCIAYNARGYPPSDVPDQADAYGWEHQRADLRAVLDRLGIERAHLVGLSMGAFACFYFGMDWPGRARSMTLAGIGTGSAAADRAPLAEQAAATAQALLAEGWPDQAQVRALSPTRVQLLAKNPRAFEEHVERLKVHSATGSALTLLGYQARRPALGDFAAQMANCTIPTLLMCGDEDEPCLEASLALKRAMPSAGLAFMPQTGHACNVEEPELFNLLLERFLHQVDSGQYRMRDPRAVPGRMV